MGDCRHEMASWLGVTPDLNWVVDACLEALRHSGHTGDWREAEAPRYYRALTAELKRDLQAANEDPWQSDSIRQLVLLGLRASNPTQEGVTPALIWKLLQTCRLNPFEDPWSIHVLAAFVRQAFGEMTGRGPAQTTLRNVCQPMNLWGQLVAMKRRALSTLSGVIHCQCCLNRLSGLYTTAGQLVCIDCWGVAAEKGFRAGQPCVWFLQSLCVECRQLGEYRCQICGDTFCRECLVLTHSEGLKSHHGLKALGEPSESSELEIETPLTPARLPPKIEPPPLDFCPGMKVFNSEGRPYWFDFQKRGWRWL